MLLSNFKYIVAISLALMASLGSSFSPQAKHPTNVSRKSATQLQVLEDSTSLMVATESWRQYVFPIVTAGVLIDIVLGSPVANSVLSPLRPDAEASGNNEDDESSSPFGLMGGGSRFDKTKLKERVDSEQIASAAVARARNSLELRRYLDDRKTDFDRMEDIKKELDAGMQDFDSGYEARAKRISEELEKRGKSLE